MPRLRLTRLQACLDTFQIGENDLLFRNILTRLRDRVGGAFATRQQGHDSSWFVNDPGSRPGAEQFFLQAFTPLSMRTVDGVGGLLWREFKQDDGLRDHEVVSQ